ncbi:MAG: response regulator [Thermodesulfobacteriota bacterium]|nr:response regulator [Thermodesulfobacteriota bacterium]
MVPLRVLVVDDEDDFRQTLVMRLQKRELDVVGVRSGEEALELLGKKGFDVVTLGVKMPGMDGVEVLGEIKKKWPLLEVIMLSGCASVACGVESMRLGAFDYVVKPPDMDELYEKLQKAYERKSLQEEQAHHARANEGNDHPQKAAE